MAGNFQHRELSGSLFRNDKKDSASQPDYRGDCLINGVAYWTSGWIKMTQRGDKFLSMAYTRKADKDQPDGDGGFSQPRPSPSLGDDDDLPF